MKTRIAIALLLSASFGLSACNSEKVQVLKSPCACGPKRPVNGNENTAS